MKDLATVVKEFSDSIAAQTDALRVGDSKTGNKHAKRHNRAIDELLARGDEGRDALVPLMSESLRADVRVAAASCLLRYRHDEAQRVLREIARGEGYAAFVAGEVLSRWDEGVWNLDPP